VGHPLRLERLDRGERAERRVAVVGGASTVEPIVATDRRPRAEALAPARHLGLLVEMAVEEDGVVGVTRHLHQQHRRPAGQPHDLHLETLDGTLARPSRRELHGPIQVAVRLPLLVEARRLRGNADVLG
jgi:hypothetical protein